jgi:periplasmic protein TonB
LEALDQVLKRRSRAKPWYRGGSLIGAIVLHIGLVAAAIVAPRLFAGERPETPEFVSIQIVPAAALGQIEVPPPPPPAAPPAPAIEEAPPPAPAPEPEPERPVSTKERDPERKTPVEPAPPPSAVPPPSPLAATPLDATNPESTAPPGRLGSPQGNPLATGGPAEISGFDDPDFTYSYYAELMLARIRARWQRPALGGDIQMVVYFKVHEDGKVTDVEILESSGYNSFDRAGLRAVQTATLPPLPKSYRRGVLGVHLIIR